MGMGGGVHRKLRRKRGGAKLDNLSRTCLNTIVPSTHPHTGGDKNVQGANGCV